MLYISFWPIFTYFALGEICTPTTTEQDVYHSLKCTRYTHRTCDVITILPPGTVRTSEGYCQTVFGPYIERQLQSVKRVDMVWDAYREGSLKRTTHERRGTGKRRQVTMSTRIPTYWKGFLRNDEDKNELFLLLASYVVSMVIPDEKELYTTSGESVLSSSNRMNLTNLAPCTHEEADTRLMAHVLDASCCGHRRIMIRTSETDVVVLAVSIVSRISAEDLCVAYGTGKTPAEHCCPYHCRSVRTWESFCFAHVPRPYWL